MRYLIYSLLLFISSTVWSQSTIPLVLKKFNKQSVPYLKVAEIKDHANLVFIDAREPKEFNVSHIKGAISVGFDHFKMKNVSTAVPDKKATVVVYCSIGVRSEKIGEQLLKAGYKNVYNLYGGIFEYKNQGGTVVNNTNIKTDSIHTFNKEWSVYLNKGIKVYEN